MSLSSISRRAPKTALSVRLMICIVTFASTPALLSAAPMFFSNNLGEFMQALHDEGLHHDNVMFNNSNLMLGGRTVQGYVNGTNLELVNISSTTLLIAGGGQAPGVGAASETFRDAIFSLHADNDTDLFRSLSFNIDSNGNEVKTVTVVLLNEAGDQIHQQPYEFEVSNGNNFFGVLGADNFNFAHVKLTSSGELDAIAQIRTTLAAGVALPPPPTPGPGPGPTAVASPEPTSIAIWTLLGLALTGFGYYRARRNK